VPEPSSPSETLTPVGAADHSLPGFSCSIDYTGRSQTAQSIWPKPIR